MNKLLYTSALCAFSVLMGANAAKAVDFPEHYRTLDVNVSYTKQSIDFTAKNIFPFHFPDNLPGTPVFKGAKGQFSTNTETTLEDGVDITSSETLFSVEFTTDRCPKEAEISYSMDQSFPGTHYPLLGNIVKQAQGGLEGQGLTQVSNVDFMNNYDIPMNMGKNGCGVVSFDGTDFQNKPYTMNANLQLKYTFQPITVGLDGEFIISANNQKEPALNAYVVVPVIKGDGKGNGVIRPGTIFSVGGNISTTATNPKATGDWFVRYVTAVYKNNSCQVAFKKHAATKFTANTPTGIGSAPNPTSALWPTATIISDFTVAGNGRETIMRQVNGNHRLPVHVEDGDCVVQAALPYGNSSSINETYMNMESQSKVTYIPD